MATIAPRDPIALPHLPSGPEEALATLDAVRERTFALVAHLSEDQLSRVLSPIMSPLVWDLAHIAAYEDLWLSHRHGGAELLRPELAELYDAFETPRSMRGEVELLGPTQARAYLHEVRLRSAEALAARGVGDGTIYELVLRHELQHTETMRQTMALAGLLPEGEPPFRRLAGDMLQPPGGRPAGDVAQASMSPGEEMLLERGQATDSWVHIQAGPFEMGAVDEGFAYDNERPRHTVELGAFAIARLPVSNAEWMSFSDGGGYERREWWSREGWAWKGQEDITGAHRGVAAAPPEAPVCHVSWFEAEAFAAGAQARLASEAEWEKACALGALAGAGLVWEWTSSHFVGYPGFVAHPYREYSEVFFGSDYRVLRGGSWATDARVKTRTFRNWDLPIRRQIFAGLRLAKDCS